MLIATTANILAMILQIYKYILIIRILLSWFPQILFSGNPLVVMMLRLTDIPLFYLRKWLPFLQIGFLDFSPIILFILVDYLTMWCLQVAHAYSLGL